MYIWACKYNANTTPHFLACKVGLNLALFFYFMLTAVTCIVREAPENFRVVYENPLSLISCFDTAFKILRATQWIIDIFFKIFWDSQTTATRFWSPCMIPQISHLCSNDNFSTNRYHLRFGGKVIYLSIICTFKAVGTQNHNRNF